MPSPPANPSASPLLTLAREAAEGLLDLVYPPKCLVCGALGDVVLCARCRADFLPLVAPLCDRCGEMIAAGRRPELCDACAGGESRYFARARAAGRYDGALRDAVLRLKYGCKGRLGPALGAFLAEYLLSEPFGRAAFDLVVPVPLHPSKLRERGFNQSELIGETAATALCLPFSPRALKRIRRTKPQASLREVERARNVLDAFAVNDAAAVHGKRVLLVDDVLTTCYTVDECARVLIGAGAAEVCVAAVARGL